MTLLFLSHEHADDDIETISLSEVPGDKSNDFPELQEVSSLAFELRAIIKNSLPLAEAKDFHQNGDEN